MNRAVWLVLLMFVSFFAVFAYYMRDTPREYEPDPIPYHAPTNESTAAPIVPVKPSEPSTTPAVAPPSPARSPELRIPGSLDVNGGPGINFDPKEKIEYGTGIPYVDLPKPASFGALNTKPVSNVDYPRPQRGDLDALKTRIAPLEAQPNDRAALARTTQFLFAKGWYAEAVPYIDRYLAAGGTLDDSVLLASVNYAARSSLQTGILPGGNGAYIRGLAMLGRFEQAHVILKKLDAAQPGFDDAGLYSVYLHYYEFLLEGRDKGNLGAAARALIKMNEVCPTAAYLDLDNLALVDFMQMLSRLVESRERPSLAALDEIWPFFPPHILQPIAQDLTKAGFRISPSLVAAIHPLNEGRPCHPSAMIRRSWFAYARAKDSELAYQQARAALDHARSRKDERLLLYSLWNMADFAHRLGDLPLESDCVKEAQTLSDKFNLEGFRVGTELRLGALQEQLADDGTALETFKSALLRCVKFKAGSSEFKAMHALSSAASRMGEPALAEPTLRDLVAAAERASPGIGLRAGPYYSLGRCLLSQGKLDEAVQYLGKVALAPDPQFRSRAMLELGRAELLAKRPQRAQEMYGKVLGVLNELDDPEVRWQALTGMARALSAQNQPDLALQPVAAAMDVIDAQRASVADYHRRRNFQSNKEEPYQLAVQLALQKNNTAIAYAVAERARARTLLDTLNAAHGTPADRPRTAPSLDALQRAASGISVVVFLVTDDSVLAWVTNPRETRFHRLPHKPRELFAEIGGLLRAIVRNDADWKSRSAALHKKLWAPLLPNVPSGERVCIVPHGFLHYLPFQALHDGAQFALERNELFYAPSGTALAELRAAPDAPAANGIVLADPLLSSDPASPFRTTETAKLREIYPAAKVLLQKNATLDAFIAALPGIDRIHVSSHGYFNSDLPSRSGLVFSKGDGTEILTAERIATLDLRGCNLVVLSACVSSVGALAGGDEVTGVTRAFQTAGAANVIGSLWPVENAATTNLMTAFYTNLKAKPGDPTAALCAAQRAAIRQGITPARWAAFEINGPGLKR